ncbi:general substrate transporter [Aspergillus carlsbadensis]|nr:general substrate transporter [Aspergillus carlsbadensis]
MPQSASRQIAIGDGHILHTLRIAALVSAGAFLVGYNAGVIPTIVGEQRWNSLMKPADNWATADIFSVYNLGALVGSLCTGQLADVYGREMVLVLSSLVCVVGTVIQLSSFTIPQWIVGHIVLGWGIGALGAGIPIYISEIAPRTHRCRLTAIEQLAYYAGFLSGFWLGYCCRFISTPHWWRLALALELVPALILGLGCFYWAPPSPRWLVAQGRNNQARQVLRRLHGADLAELELEQMQETIRAEKHINLPWAAFWKSPILKLTALACGVRSFQQVTGSQSVMFYTPSLFEKAGLPTPHAYLFGTIGILGVIFHSAWIPMRWFDRLGRKTWLQVGTIGMGISLSMSSVLQLKMEQHPDWHGRYMLILFPFLFYIFHNLGWTIAGSTYASEIFPMPLRARGIALTTALGWALKYFVAVSPSLGDAIGWGLYLVYAMISVLAFVFVRFTLVETKDKQLEEMSELFGLADYFSAMGGRWRGGT